MNGLEWRLKLIRALKRKLGGTCLIASYSDSNICIPDGSGILDLVYRMEDRPDEILELNENILHQGIEDGLRMIDAGADILVNACDIAFNSGTFFTSGQLEKFIYPYFIRWNDMFSRDDIFTVLHTDGNVTKILNQIADCGFHALQCIDPIAGMDIVASKRKMHEKLALVGNMNVSTLHIGTPEEIENEARAILEGCKEGGGFVFGACNAVFHGIPAENYRIMLECRKKYGQTESK
jgi:uroporphyrinogen decarboxylase